MKKKLKSYDDLFYGTVNDVVELNISDLVPYSNHPFKLYNGERLEDMKRSIEENGIMVPIIVRKKDDKYEILSGHNRVNASKEIGLELVPAIIYEHIDNDDALLIVTETNFMQRSFSDMSPSEKAKSLKIYYDSIKRQGKRNDLTISLNESTCT